MTDTEIAEMENEKQKNQAYLEANRIPKTVNTPLSEEQGAMVKQIIAGKDYAAIEKELNELKAKQEKEGGKGQLDANLGGQLARELGNSNSSDFKEFNSFEEMADFYRNSKDPQDKEKYKKLYMQCFNKVKTLSQTYDYPLIADSEGNILDSPVKRALEAQNEKVRKKVK
jgi:hypothetical protein